MIGRARQRQLLYPLLLATSLGVVWACTSTGGSGGFTAVRECHSCSFHDVIMAAADAAAEIDAQVLRYSAAQHESKAYVLLLQDWRLPRRESAVLHVTISGGRLELRGDIVASLEHQGGQDDRPPEEGGGGCDCGDVLSKVDARERINNGLVMANLRRTTRAFLAAFDARIGE